MTSPSPATAVIITGRPLRALALLGLALGVGLMLRLPILQRDLAAISARLGAAGDVIFRPILAPFTAEITAPIILAGTVAILIPARIPATIHPTPVPGAKPPRQSPEPAPGAIENHPEIPQIATRAADPVTDPDYAAQALPASPPATAAPPSAFSTRLSPATTRAARNGNDSAIA
ncbi:hypothetical protein GCM10011529_23750 [Polymorphobacter glacialis]|uniref:Uncharacterized protein n=1 Tax=Sandarakinorhabdus glacialis TaxID=1614636 RepID=A0A916ZWK5_9SPHN|nr:hypothetical protein [Polymorphobacter glacialis]GGE16560.1 hypothetical protein GCM10011529_23750 [Polymorphobacter glacialis]